MWSPIIQLSKSSSSHFVRSLSEGFEGCSELSALSICLTGSCGEKKEKRNHASELQYQSTSKASPQITLRPSWVQCVCGWVHEKESVPSAYCVGERTRRTRVLVVPSMPN